MLAICGSLPGWETADFDPLRAALERWLQRGRLVADTYGPPLTWLAKQPLDLIKINRTEFAAWQGSLPAGTPASIPRTCDRSPPCAPGS